MNLVKTTLRNRLTNDSLNSILHVTMSGISLASFRKEHPENCVKYCFNAKSCRQGQQKRKLHEKAESKKVNKRIVAFQIYLHIRTAPTHTNQRTKILFDVFYFYYCDPKFVSNVS